MVMLRATELDELELPEEEEVKWAGHYSSAHKILLVGDGDFSFSLSLANSFGSASNMVATSLDTYDTVVSKYSNAKSNISELSRLGATLLHGVDATRMRLHPDLRQRRFDRIVFNFPHAGFKGREDNPELIGQHRRLVQGFMRNAREMLRQDGDGGGEVHVSHKTGPTFCRWNLPSLARECGLEPVGVTAFPADDYPGYSNKRGDGDRADQPFPLKECCTYMFVAGRPEKKRKKSTATGFGAADRSVGPGCGIRISGGFVGVDARPPLFVPVHKGVGVGGRDCSWSWSIPSGSWSIPPHAAAPAPAPPSAYFRTAPPSAYFRTVHEDNTVALLQTLGCSVDTWRRVAPPTSSSCQFGLRRTRGA